MTETTTPKSPALEAAEIAKLNADVVALGAAAAKDAAIALKEQRNAEMSAITLAERVRVEELTLVQDHYVFHHTFDGPVNPTNVYGLLNTMSAWHRQYPQSNWTIDINSPGGSVIAGMHLFDQIIAHSKRGGGSHHITMTVRGYAASMAGILLQAADTRRCGPESYVMIHEVSSFAQGKIGELKDEIKFLDVMSERIKDIFVARANEVAAVTEGVTGITHEDFQAKWHRQDWWLTSKDSLAYGFIDEIG